MLKKALKKAAPSSFFFIASPFHTLSFWSKRPTLPFLIIFKASFNFSKAQSKLKPPKNKYEESERDFEDIISVFAESDQEGVNLNAKDESDEDPKTNPNDSSINFNFIVEKEPIKAALNLQNFVMGASEKLSGMNLRHFLHEVESFKTKMSSSPTFKYKKALKNRIFLKKCLRIFEKDNAKELLDLFMICDINRISHENFSSTVFNFEEEMELKNKITKFNEFNYTQIPKNRPIISDLEAKHKKLQKLTNIHPDSQSDKDLLSKISKFKLQGNFAEKETIKKEINFINDLEENDENNEAEGNSENTTKKLLDVINQEIDENLNFSLNYAKEIKEEILKIDKNIEFDKKFSIGDNHVEKARKTLCSTTALKTDIRLQQPKEILILQQKSFAKREIIKTNWVYLSGLPYVIEDQEGFEKILKEKFESFAGRIKNIKIFNYKDFLSVKHDNQRTYSLSAKTDIEKSFLPFQEKQENNDFKLEKEHFKQIEPLQEEIKTPNLGEILKNMNINFDMAKEKQDEQNSAKIKKKKTEKILMNIKEKSFKKLDRSYALLEFEDQASKEKALIPEMRVFGMKLGKNMCMTDDADYKLTLICNNVHWGASLEKFCEKINLEFSKNNSLDLKIEINPEDSKKIITKYFLLIRFSNFPSTVKALYTLQDAVFENRILRFHHLYGSLKKYKTSYYEILDSEGQNEILKMINERKMSEFSKVNQINEENEPMGTEIQDLLLEEGTNLIAENEEDFPPFFMHEHPDEEGIEEKYNRFSKKYAEIEELERLEKERFHY